jgi:hypothetical protein
MTFFEEGMAWLSGLFLFVIVLFIAMMIWRNRAAKSDTVRRKEEDTITNSVSLKPKKNSRKLD